MKRIQTARQLRSDMTDAERCLWGSLRAKQLDGFKFRRQHPLGPYVVDFACLEAGLVIEIDGGQHASGKEKDSVRSSFIEKEGFFVRRFWNHEVLGNLPGVLEVIRRDLLKLAPTSILPRKRERKDSLGREPERRRQGG